MPFTAVKTDFFRLFMVLLILQIIFMKLRSNCCKNRLLSAFYGFIDIANNIYEAEVKS